MSDYVPMYPMPTRAEIIYQIRQKPATRADVEDAEERIMKRLDALFRAAMNAEPPAREPHDAASRYFGKEQR